MKNRMIWMGILIAACAIAYAKDYPLTRTRLTPRQAFETPGGAAAFCREMTPNGAKGEASVLSLTPVDGQLPQGEWFRLEASRNAGTHYDRLRLDANGNGDLNDDAPLAALPASQVRDFAGEDAMVFGPVALSGGSTGPVTRGECYLQAILYDRAFDTFPGKRRDQVRGLVTIKPAWTLVLTGEVAGAQQRIAFLDADADGRIATTLRYRDPGALRPGLWDVQAADYVLRDRDGSGTFEPRRFEPEAEPFNELLYFSGKPFQVVLSDDLSKANLAPWSGPTGSLAISPDSGVRSVMLLRQAVGKDWECVVPEIVAGKTALPAGNYRLLRCLVSRTNQSGRVTLAVGNDRQPNRDLAVRTGQTLSLACGLPFTLQLKAETTERYDARANSRFMAIMSGKYYEGLQFSAQVVGAGGEQYTQVFQGRPGSVLSPLQPPRYQVRAGNGRWVASGTMKPGMDGFYQASVEVPRRAVDRMAVVRVEKDIGALRPRGEPLRSAPVLVQL